MSGLVFAAIAPHGDLAIPEADPTGVGLETQRGMEELERRFEAARPDATILVTPHNVHVEGSFAVVVAASLTGALDDYLDDVVPLQLTCPVDRELAAGVQEAIRDAAIHVVGVSFGGNLAEESVMPMDWGTLVPLWFFGGRADPQVPAVVVSPARDRSLAEHVRVGAAIAEASRASGKRVALVASADHGHAHDPDGRYGYDPAAEEFDRRVVDLLRENRLAGLLDLDPALVSAAKADSWWQMVVLHGALGEGWEAKVLSYEAPTYYGMLCASFEQ